MTRFWPLLPIVIHTACDFFALVDLSFCSSPARVDSGVAVEDLLFACIDAGATEGGDKGWYRLWLETD